MYIVWHLSKMLRIILRQNVIYFPMTSTPSLLETSNLTKAFKGLIALQNHSVRVERSELIGVIGPNGSGKSTLFNVISGFLAPTSGSVKLEGQDIGGLEPAHISRLGIARTFQGTRLFKNLSVLENVRVSAQLRHPVNIAQALFGGMNTQNAAIDSIALELLKLVKLEKRIHDKAGSLPYGDQRRLEIARALATRPKLLMLDEPAAGLDSSETQALLELIRIIRDQYQVAVIVIEHDMELIMNLCERIQVLAYGNTIGEGTPKQVQVNPRVREAYLGASNGAAA
jgi:branched-chain amino acid transport system ATP-binding protein